MDWAPAASGCEIPTSGKFGRTWAPGLLRLSKIIYPAEADALTVFCTYIYVIQVFLQEHFAQSLQLAFVFEDAEGRIALLALAALFAFIAFALLAIGWSGRRGFFYDGEVDLLFDGIDAVDQDSQAVAEAVDFARVLADDFARVLVVGIAVVDEGVERDKPFDEEVGEFDEESEFRDAGDEAVEVFSDAVLHELRLSSIPSARARRRRRGVRSGSTLRRWRGVLRGGSGR